MDRLITAGKVRAGIYGVCVGDALGVPAEMSHGTMPITDMVGGGVHGQPRGTWSDDSSLTLCLAESIAETGGIHSNDIMRRFSDWNTHGAYTPWGECFDCGHSTKKAILRFNAGKPAALCGDNKMNTNGNGSLMRILPMVFAILSRDKGLPLSSRSMEEIHKVSALTHRHPLAQSACGIYVSVAANLVIHGGLETAVSSGVEDALRWYMSHAAFQQSLPYWSRLRYVRQFSELPAKEIRASSYVVDTLEAALWCLLNTDNYRECVLKAVNLGGDPDTTAAVAGGIAGLAYGYGSIPAEWIDALAGKEIIERCCNKLADFAVKRESQ